MAFHKKFTFDDPEDSYWNQTASRTVLFDDIGAKQTEAQAALNDLFETSGSREGTLGLAPSCSEQGDDGNTATRVAARDAAPVLERPPSTSGEKGSSTERGSTCSSAPAQNVCNNNGAGERLTTGSPLMLNAGLDLPHNQRSISMAPVAQKHMSAASLVSECSASSLPSDANKFDLDYSRLKQEHRNLQKKYNEIRHGRFRAVDANESAKRLLAGEPVSLDLYRSRAEKAQLLDAACDLIDQQTILTVVLYLKSSLSDTLFRELLLTKPEAVEAYVEHLKQAKEIEELSTALFALGRNSDAAMVELSAASRVRTPSSRLAALKGCLGNSFLDPQLAAESSLLQDEINLLERQLAIEADDAKISAVHSVMKEFPRRAPLAGQSAIATLYYCALYHYDLPQGNIASPFSVSQLMRLNDKEHVWTTVSALVRQSRWPDVERVLQAKSIVKTLHSRGLLSGGLSSSMGGGGASAGRLSCPFSWRNLFRVLHSSGTQPPKDFLCRILRSVGDDAERLRLATKANVPEIVIECLVASRERERLAAYAASLPHRSPESFKALAALDNQSIKWKTG